LSILAIRSNRQQETVLIAKYSLISQKQRRYFWISIDAETRIGFFKRRQIACCSFEK